MKGFIEVTSVEHEEKELVNIAHILCVTEYCDSRTFIYLDGANWELSIETEESYEQIKAKIEEASK